MRCRLRFLVVVALLTLALLTGCSTKSAAPAPVQRTIYMTALEYKGGTAVASEPFPAGATAGKGYILKAPDKDGRWETSTYRWEPGTVVVYQGDQVQLDIWGVNGSQHPSRIEGYVPSFNVKRGQLTTLKFTADKPGVFSITCAEHGPSMQGQLVVLPR